MISILPLASASPKTVDEMNALARELHLEGTADVTLERVNEMLATPNVILLTVQDEGAVIGMATLHITPTIEDCIGHVDDVVVSSAYRGQGLGEKLMRALIEAAKKRGVSSLHLTSRPARVAAQALYMKVGFKKRETDVFKLSL